MAKHFSLRNCDVEGRPVKHSGENLCLRRLYIGEQIVFSFSCLAKCGILFPAYVVFTDQGRMLVADMHDGDVIDSTIYKTDAKKIGWTDWTGGKWLNKYSYSVLFFKDLEFQLWGDNYSNNEALKLLQETVKKYGN